MIEYKYSKKSTIINGYNLHAMHNVHTSLASCLSLLLLKLPTGKDGMCYYSFVGEKRDEEKMKNEAGNDTKHLHLHQTSQSSATVETRPRSLVAAIG